jgi:uncharacterized protein YcgI (DUF1989 family)
MSDLIKVPARCGKAHRVARGQHIQIVNTHGSQVVDTWAFNANDLGEWMSMEHTRATIDKMMPDLGEAFLTICEQPWPNWVWNPDAPPARSTCFRTGLGKWATGSSRIRPRASPATR